MTREDEIVHIVDCNNGWCKAAYRIAAVALPVSLVWFFSQPVYMVGLIIILLLCMSNRMQLTDKLIVMPAWDFEDFPIDSLVSVSFEYGDTTDTKPAFVVFQFKLPPDAIQIQGDPPGYRIRRIGVSRLAGSKSVTLLRLIDRYSPKCVVAPEVRRFLLGVNFTHKLAKAGELEIHYFALEKVKAFLTLIKSYELYFWRVYSLLVAVPLFLYILMCVSLSQVWSRSTADALLALLNPIFGIGSTALGFFTYNYFNVFSLPIIVYIGSILTSALIMQFLSMLWQPNRVILNQVSLDIAKEFYGFALYREKHLWSDLRSISLVKPKGSTAPEQWSIAFNRTNGDEAVLLSLSAIKGDQDRVTLLSATEQWAPHLTRDPQLIEILRPAQKQSYTELWLQALSTPPKRERLTPLSPGVVLKQCEYLITNQLGTGGQGVAYLATRSSDGHSIVVKEFVLPVFVEKAARRRSLEKFEQEAQLLQKLDHPLVVRLLDYFIEDHRAYLVLEHIKGRSLRRIVDEDGALSQMQVCALAEQMCDMLKYLHGLDPPLVHRDFTPDNLILNDEGTLKLIDFNVAYRKRVQTTATVVGKHAYLPPEQFRGKPVPQSDIYALGACLHFLLTGKDPEPVSVARPIESCPDIDPALEAIVERATALSTTDRFDTAESVLQALREFQIPVDLSVHSIHIPEQDEYVAVRTNTG